MNVKILTKGQFTYSLILVIDQGAFWLIAFAGTIEAPSLRLKGAPRDVINELDLSDEFLEGLGITAASSLTDTQQKEFMIFPRS